MEANQQASLDQSPKSASGQKRSRDYGELLKGLTPDPESGGEQTPPQKRTKTAQDAGEGDHSDGLDDGEIVEELEPGQRAEEQPAQATLHANRQPPPSDPAPLEAVASKINKIPEADATKATGSVDGAEGTEVLGDEAESPAEPAANAPAGWNRGVGLGLRTSFGKSAKQTKTTESPKTLKFTALGRTLSINTTKFGEVDIQTKPALARVENATFWKQWIRSHIDEIIQTLAEDNDLSLDDITKKGMHSAVKALANSIMKGSQEQKLLVKPALDTAVTKFNGPKHKAAIERVRKTLAKATVGGSSQAQSPATPHSAAEKKDDATDEQSYEPDSDVGSNASPLESQSESQPLALSGEEYQDRTLYFPGSERLPTFCTHCVSVRHDSSECPQLKCQFCESSTHSRFACPTKERCSKCQQLGHSKATCQEKLTLAKEEIAPCVFCGAAHTEDECTEIWRSFNPAEVEIKKVKAIPAFCYTCGRSGHYGPECGLPGRSSQPNVTSRVWSVAVRDIYVDSESADVAIAWTGLDADVAQAQSDFHIRGKATKQTHVQYVSSDDSDNVFIKAPVQKSQPRGGIRINTGGKQSQPPPPSRRGDRNSRPQQGRRRQGEREFSAPPPPPPELYGGSGNWQPPLPTGPPPPLPQSASRGYGAPPANLPPRPSNHQSNSGPPRKRRGRGNRGRGN
ncbi:hypothetical protein BX600DRAFT_510114 [Xylariales sp. PMI_506]|nr:hypothetical protein BX600DRAFT_510114 [Xylariales sp. PMI_506]